MGNNFSVHMCKTDKKKKKKVCAQKLKVVIVAKAASTKFCLGVLHFVFLVMKNVDHLGKYLSVDQFLIYFIVHFYTVNHEKSQGGDYFFLL